MTYKYKTRGTCSTNIYFEVDENDVVHNVRFEHGCSGNTQGICKLVEGMKREEVIERLDGILCGSKKTSCPDQLANALKQTRQN